MEIVGGDRVASDFAIDAMNEIIEARATRAEFGDCETGLGCRDGYAYGSVTAAARKEAADDIRRMKIKP